MMIMMMKNSIGQFWTVSFSLWTKVSQTLQSVLCITTDKYLVCVLLHACFSIVGPTPFLLAAIFFSGHPYTFTPSMCDDMTNKTKHTNKQKHINREAPPPQCYKDEALNNDIITQKTAANLVIKNTRRTILTACKPVHVYVRITVKK